MSQKINSLLSKHESYYNHKKSPSLFKYDDQSILYSNLTEVSVVNDKKKMIEIEKSLFTNTRNYHLKLSKPNIHQHDNIISCEVKLNFYEILTGDREQFLQKLYIKDVNMNALIEDLNKSINVDNLITELQKHGKNLQPIIEYMNKQNMDLTKLMLILYRNNVTIPNVLKNPYIYDLIKSSSTHSWIIGKHERPHDIKIVNKKLVEKIHLYILFKIKNDEPHIININYNKL